MFQNYQDAFELAARELVGNANEDFLEAICKEYGIDMNKLSEEDYNHLTAY